MQPRAVTEDSIMLATTALPAEPQQVPSQLAYPSPAAATAPADAAPVRDAHIDRLHELLRLETANDYAKPHQRGPRGRRRRQQARQRLQQRIRREAVACYHHLRDQGCTLGQCGQLLNLSPRTLRQWDQDCRLSRPETITLVGVGRPAARSPLPVRQQIIDYFKLTGPGIGVPTLQEHFRNVARAELADLLARYRAVCRARHAELQRVLHWQTPGRVWAADFTEPSRYATAVSLPPIASLYPYVLAVRDLASGSMLAWQALPNLTEEVTREALAHLFALHGAPLILKMDNGSAFRADEFKLFLETSGVIPLYSPPSCPGYNGAIEAAIGSLKKRTENEAHAQGRSGQWALADLAAAQTAANASHPRRLNGRTPASVWESRTPIEPLERVIFELTLERQRFRARDELRIDPEELLDHWRASAVDRHAIERALVEHGYLLFTRRRIPLTIRPGKVARDV